MGPTASGKSAYAQALAHAHNGLIINADSLQIYQGLEILTAQPSSQDHRAFPHHLYGFFNPEELSSMGNWMTLALQSLESAVKEGYTPIVVGGTGLYLKVLTEGLLYLPPIAPEMRQSLNEQETPILYETLQKNDPELAARIAPQDRQRITRGLEVFYGTGLPLSQWQAQKPKPPPYHFETHLLSPPSDLLHAHMEKRLNGMLDQGVLEEVKVALSRPLSVTSRKAIGLQELGSYLRGEIPLQQAKDMTLLQTRQYAKRQNTWFRHQLKHDYVIEDSLR